MKKLPGKSSRTDIDQFLNKVAATQRIKPAGERGRLIFAMDATASREPTWERACHIQGEMFQTTSSIGGLDIQLCYYRGFNEFYTSLWLNNANDLLQQMTAATCLGGHTQIAKVLEHAKKETKVKKVNALVFIGDCVEENTDNLCRLAGQLGILGVPLFLFQEGFEPIARGAFKQMASISQGAYCSFDVNSAQQLKDLLSAVAVYASAGRSALENFSQKRGSTVLQLTRQIGKNKP